MIPPSVKPHYQIPIQDCGEPLVAIPLDRFSVVQPHPYVALGAPYRLRSPYYLREGVLTALLTAQQQLQITHPGWQIQIFDAYRPIAVQQFMVEHAYQQLLTAHGLEAQTLSPAEQSQLLQTVYQFWAPPSLDPTTPPPHSTGAAIDVTLVNTHNQSIDMGSPIDELSARSFPDHFAHQQNTAPYHAHRQLLKTIMAHADFQQHPNEWWHFSLGDQLWAWQHQQTTPGKQWIAHYGSI